MNEEIVNHKSLYHKKMVELFGKILKADWEPDKSYEMKSQGKTVIIRYVTLSKIRRNIAPLLFNSGLDWDVDFSEPMYNGETVSVKAFITFTDTDTGYSETHTTIGSSNKGDKGTQIAQSFAVKTYLTNKFWIIDGADPDREDLDSPVRTGKEFTPKKMEEVNEIKSKIQDKMIPQPFIEPPKAPVQEKPKEEIQVNMDAVEAKEGVTDSIGYVMTSIEARTVNSIEAKWKQKLESGDVTEEQYKAMDDARLDANSHEAVVDFIRKYKVI